VGNIVNYFIFLSKKIDLPFLKIVSVKTNRQEVGLRPTCNMFKRELLQDKTKGTWEKI